ncbi:hypothetical protein JCM17380_26830 [Desulfosporosinus burensis]
MAVIPTIEGTNIMVTYEFISNPTIFKAIRFARLLTAIGALEAVAINAPEIR